MIANAPVFDLPKPAASLPTLFGAFQIRVFEIEGKEHIALVRGDVAGGVDVPIRVHSECMTGDVFGSLRCDCRAQLELAVTKLGEAERGVLLYLRQEGRGIGLANKIRAYALQERGMDTVDANLALGFRDDQRTYAAAAEMLSILGVKSVRVMTNNPDKIAQLRGAGVEVSGRISHLATPTPQNRFYLETKAKRSGHLIDLGPSVIK
jgi:GTP cyclohydrolase II